MNDRVSIHQQLYVVLYIVIVLSWLLSIVFNLYYHTLQPLIYQRL